MSVEYARPTNHVALSVNDIEAVTKWYTDMLGFQIIGGKIMHIKRSETPSAGIFQIYGDSLHEVKLAYMATGNGVGFEVFEFLNPGFKKNDVDFEYNRAGFFHICVTDPNPEVLLEKVLSKGASRVGNAVTFPTGITCIYFKDPWGNVVEILSSSFDRMATLDTA
ncbi:hypothetical protein EDB80DRAFT_655707 [Ilyonectria destructans]|nr:hypothetical protein EDB80DRAFT_655707 [Ilyonectria destructans]